MAKPFTKTELNLLERLDLVLPAEDQKRDNPYTGASRRLEPLAAALYDFITDSQAEGDLDTFGRPPNVRFNDRVFKIRYLDRARLLFRLHYPDEYYELID